MRSPDKVRGTKYEVRKAWRKTSNGWLTDVTPISSAKVSSHVGEQEARNPALLICYLARHSAASSELVSLRSKEPCIL